jgi:hypothetical protein
MVIPQMLSGRHVTAYPPGRVHRAVPPIQDQQAASGSEGLHEIKHDGFRVTARKAGIRVSLQPPRHDLTYPFPLILETLVRLRSRSCIIDGEAEEDWGRGEMAITRRSVDGKRLSDPETRLNFAPIR